MIVIVDLDGTICDSSERLKEVGFDPTKPISEWPTTWGDPSTDKPIREVIDLVNLLYCQYHIWIVSLRDDESQRGDTKMWLYENDVPYSRIELLGNRAQMNMKPAEMKRKWLNSLDYDMREDILMAIEDSPSIIQMYREEDIRVLDVGQFLGSM